MLARDLSYNHAAEVLNQIYHREDDSKFLPTSLKYRIEAIGKRLSSEYQASAESILSQKGFDADTGKLPNNPRLLPCPLTFTSVPVALVDGKQEQTTIDNLNKNRLPIEQIHIKKVTDSKIEVSKENVCYISIDDIGVKRQKEKRSPSFKKECVYVENTVIHIQTNTSRFVITAIGMQKAFKILMAYLVENNILESHRLVFFTDGATIIKSYIEDYFSFLEDYTIILDWFHLAKRCKELLSMSVRGSKEEKHDIRKGLLRILWVGNVEGAKTYLSNLKTKNIKNADMIKELEKYLDRKSAFITCYAMRRFLNLKVSSNVVEKANDMVVAKRQKHNGMSWSADGSGALAILEATDINGNLQDRLRGKAISLKMAA